MQRSPDKPHPFRASQRALPASDARPDMPSGVTRAPRTSTPPAPRAMHRSTPSAIAHILPIPTTAAARIRGCKSAGARCHPIVHLRTAAAPALVLAFLVLPASLSRVLSPSSTGRDWLKRSTSSLPNSTPRRAGTRGVRPPPPPRRWGTEHAAGGRLVSPLPSSLENKPPAPAPPHLRWLGQPAALDGLTPHLTEGVTLARPRCREASSALIDLRRMAPPTAQRRARDCNRPRKIGGWSCDGPGRSRTEVRGGRNKGRRCPADGGAVLQARIECECPAPCERRTRRRGRSRPLQTVPRATGQNSIPIDGLRRGQCVALCARGGTAQEIHRVTHAPVTTKDTKNPKRATQLVTSADPH
ncbi:hypothetical protein C8Q77DRAFT_663899 [Trametes polyzona]|nr:hypothetical protein C8Q77DRAFT_663899 [Trametes polyzona]